MLEAVVLERGDVLFLVLPFIVLFALSFGFTMVVRRRSRLRRVVAESPARDRPTLGPSSPAIALARSWWENPFLWLGVCAVFAVLGLFVWPGLFGGTFLFLPLVWVWRPPRPAAMDPRTNGPRSGKGEPVTLADGIGDRWTSGASGRTVGVMDVFVFLAVMAAFVMGSRGVQRGLEAWFRSLRAFSETAPR